MQATGFEDAKLLWKVYYAAPCFQQAREAAQHIFDNKLEKEKSPIFQPLIVAIYTLYAKPFTRSDGVGRLEETFVPNQHLQEHKIMLQHRNEIYAHRDADSFPLADFGAVNQVRAVRTREVMGLVATEFHARYTMMPPIIKLCRALEEKAADNMKELWDKHKSKIPNKIGEYLLNVLDQNADMWLPQKPMFSCPL
jgi:hypothetical protein